MESCLSQFEFEGFVKNKKASNYYLISMMTHYKIMESMRSIFTPVANAIRDQVHSRIQESVYDFVFDIADDKVRNQVGNRIFVDTRNSLNSK